MTISPLSDARARKPESPAAMLAVPIGARVVQLLELAYRARLPVLLEGATGIGKSQICAEAAAALGIECRVLDLSLLEPPDLIGLPVIEGNRTRYASPSELPESGRGILMLEELNRAELPVMQPALQLLSARRLHTYVLPSGWVCVAAVNPEDGEYQVNRLDPALRSRFMQVEVCAERAAWLTWARREAVHPAVIQVVATHDGAFDEAAPRSWAHASQILHTLHAAERADADLLRVALRGYLPAAWALVLVDALATLPVAIDIAADELVSERGPAALAAQVKQLAARPDALHALSTRVRHALASPLFATEVEAGRLTLASTEALLAPLPGDLREQCLDAAVRSNAASALFASLGYDVAQLISTYDERCALRAEILEWREEMLLHRVRLAIAATRAWLDRDEPALAAIQAGLVLFAQDAGSLGDELRAWLRIRGVIDETRPQGGGAAR